MNSQSSIADLAARVPATCEFCGRPLTTTEVYGHEMPNFGSCGCRESREYLAWLTDPAPGPSANPYDAAGIPSGHLRAKPECAALFRRVKDGRGLYIHGPHGAGKSTLAARVAACAVDAGWRVHWWRASKLLQDARGSWSATGSEAYRKATSARLLVIDDIGKQLPTRDAGALLLDIVDERTANEMPTVYTSNFTIGELAEQIAAIATADTAKAVASRIYGSTVRVLMDEQHGWSASRDQEALF